MINIKYIYLPAQLKDVLRDKTADLEELRDTEKLRTILSPYDLVFYECFGSELSAALHGDIERPVSDCGTSVLKEYKTAQRTAWKALETSRLKLHFVWDTSDKKDVPEGFHRYGQPYVIIEEVDQPLPPELTIKSKKDLTSRIGKELLDNYPDMVRSPDVDPIVVAYTSLYM